MVAVAEDCAFAGPEAVQSAGDADGEALHAPGEDLSTTGLDDQVQVVALDRELTDREACSLRAACEALPEHLQCCTGSQRGEALQ